MAVSGSGEGAVEAANAALWAEFERRRRADRQNRKGHVSEVQQILLEVQKERSVDGSVCPTPSLWSCTPVVPSPGGRQAPLITPSPKRTSEVQQILAEVQQQRLVAAGADTVPGQGEARRRANGRGTALGSAVTKAARKGALGAPVAPVPDSRTATSPQRRKLSFEGTSTPVGASADTPVFVSGGCVAKARAGRSPSPSRRTRDPSPPALGRSSSQAAAQRPPRARSSTPQRTLQVGAVGRCFETDEARCWAAGLRRHAERASSPNDDAAGSSSRYTIGPQGPPEAYPAGRWDDRITCPKNFGGFPSKLAPPPRRTGAIKASASSRYLEFRQATSDASTPQLRGFSPPSRLSSIHGGSSANTGRGGDSRRSRHNPFAVADAPNEANQIALLRVAEERMEQAAARLASVSLEQKMPEASTDVAPAQAMG